MRCLPPRRQELTVSLLGATRARNSSWTCAGAFHDFVSPTTHEMWMRICRILAVWDSCPGGFPFRPPAKNPMRPAKKLTTGVIARASVGPYSFVGVQNISKFRHQKCDDKVRRSQRLLCNSQLTSDMPLGQRQPIPNPIDED